MAKILLTGKCPSCGTENRLKAEKPSITATARTSFDCVKCKEKYVVIFKAQRQTSAGVSVVLYKPSDLETTVKKERVGTHGTEA